jgi:hypothetical protein
MSKITRIIKGIRVRPTTPERAQKAVEQGLSPSHPALSRIQRDNVVRVDFSKKNKP